jgi:hypothetical protein
MHAMQELKKTQSNSSGNMLVPGAVGWVLFTGMPEFSRHTDK